MNEPVPVRVAVFAGPTGGHLFPAQAFAESFRELYPDSVIEFTTSGRAGKLVSAFPDGLFDRIHYVPEFGLPHRVFSLGTLRALAIAPVVLFRSWRYLKKFRPHLCVGFASFVSYPGLRVAAWAGIPTLVHEQNVFPGKATRWLVRHMDAVAESFEGTRFPKDLKGVRTIGLPLRRSILDRPAGPKTREEKLRILVMGGSQGAQGLNRAVLGAFSGLSSEEKMKLAVTHIAGAEDQEKVSSWYRELGMTAQVYAFHKNMFELFRDTDLAVTRAGANTLFELAFYGIPAFVIPFPYAGGHQKLNAEAFARKGALEYHEESEDAAGWLKSKLRDVLAGALKLDAMTQAMKGLARPQAGMELARMASELIKK
jgi:UDP-N-acetylglucosamine--N-acetylmuramyl-(pentapeptide) pyrophosphoryl-undecaprenol N-acetylglucosamine transferase